MIRKRVSYRPTVTQDELKKIYTISFPEIQNKLLSIQKTLADDIVFLPKVLEDLEQVRKGIEYILQKQLGG